ncbi:MAG TPA: tetratricopeptide repeat protein [Candidatus Acidoferrales bacterium]|nr:tetratricopeptide repeat protein [Candidatus Acidoferrales bacterium]
MRPVPENRARDLFEKAHRAQMNGELERAVRLYKDSLEIHPTAEAHTYLGWTYHDQGNAEAAIDECKRAIAIDPDFGNPYNDIGAYLIALGRYDEAIPWLERAVTAPRYVPRHYPHFNMGRAYFAKNMLKRARECFQKALDLEPDYGLAQQAVDSLRRMIN